MRFHGSPSIGKPRMTPVSFVKTTESFEFCRLGHYLGSTFAGTDQNGPNYDIEQTVRAMHSCNSWLESAFNFQPFPNRQWCLTQCVNKLNLIYFFSFATDYF